MYVCIPQTVLALRGSHLFCTQLVLALAPQIRVRTHVLHALCIKPMCCLMICFL